MLASMESLIGSLWFGLFCAALGYIAGHYKLLLKLFKKW